MLKLPINHMEREMIINAILPKTFERKWNRLVACFGVEELAIAAVEALWEKYEGDVKASERLTAYHKKQIQKCTKRMATLKTRKV